MRFIQGTLVPRRRGFTDHQNHLIRIWEKSIICPTLQMSKHLQARQSLPHNICGAWKRCILTLNKNCLFPWLSDWRSTMEGSTAAASRGALVEHLSSLVAPQSSVLQLSTLDQAPPFPFALSVVWTKGLKLPTHWVTYLSFVVDIWVSIFFKCSFT